MSNKAAKKQKGEKSAGEMVEVLYQRMGDRWYAFSLIDDEVFFGSVDENVINVDEVGANEDLNPVANNSSQASPKFSGKA